LSELLELLHIQSVDIIGISAAGPTALAFAQRHAGKVRKLIMESAVALPWGKEIKLLSTLGFGRSEKLTWALIKLVSKLSPITMTRMMLQQLTTLDIRNVMQALEKDDILFVQNMIQSSQSGTGFLNDIEHRVGNLEGITAPTLVMYSPHDKFVPPAHAARIAAEIPTAELVEVSADTHLIWIGKSADDVWEKRLQFLRS
jgi:pimeloyl-ACP methyl ester carboxylesterase